MRYLVPNGVTAASMMIAMTAIVQASAGEYESAAWLIVWCVLLDRVDGVAARWLKASSQFGIQFDTLADLIAFCIAPALLVYFLLTRDPRYAPLFSVAARNTALVVSAGVYVLCGAVRLARFNLHAAELGAKWFRGLPVTIAAALVSTFILAAWETNAPLEMVAGTPILLMVCSGFMISTLWLPKSLKENTRVPFALIIGGVAGIYGLGFARALPIVLLAAALAYPTIGFIFGASQRDG